MEKESKKKTYSADQPEAAQDTLSFDSWFTMKVNQRRRVQAHHYDTLSAFFKKQGLTEEESPKKFDAALKAFGY